MTLFHLWILPGDVLAAPESAPGLDRCNISLSLSLSHGICQGMSWQRLQELTLVERGVNRNTIIGNRKHCKQALYGHAPNIVEHMTGMPANRSSQVMY